MSTLGEFETDVANELGLNATNDKTTIDRALNIAVVRVLEDTHCYIKRTDYTGFDGTSSDYTLDSSILVIDHMYLTSSGTRYDLERLGTPDLEYRRRVGSPTGSPTQYYAESGGMLMFWPAPGSGDTITIYGVPVPTAMSSSTDDPSSTSPTNFGGVPTTLHEAIFLRACMRLASADDDQTSAQGQRYRDWYKEEIARWHKVMRQKGGKRNARAVVNDTKRRRAYHDNSTYPAR